MEDFRINFATFLIQSNSLKFGKFRLSSGLDSSYYIDLRNIQSHPSIFHQTIISLRDKIIEDGLEFDCLATVPTSGLVFTSALAYEIFRPLIYIRKESKGYGVNNLIEGKLQKNQKVLLIDDVITTGQSLKHAIKVIRNNGAKVNNVLSILFRGNNDIIEKYTQIDIDLKFLITMTEISDILYSRNLIDREKREELKK